jgi:hypothetical protein
MSIQAMRNPTLYEVSQLREDWGLAGEEDTHLVVFLSFFGGGFVVMTGLSSGGKDAVVNAAEYCVPDNWVYQIPTSMSKTVLYQDADSINACPVHRHKDISNIAGKDWLEDIWKRHGDGNPISHSYNDVTGGEREAITQTLMPPNCMILFLASDNEQVDINDYAEVRNRALVLGIDDSAGLTKRVNTRQAKQEAGIIEYNISSDRADEIREYVSTIPMHAYGDDDPGGFLNPVMPAMDRQNPLPQHFTEARRDFPRLSQFMKSVTLFHYDDRIEVPQKMWSGDNRITNDVTLLVTPADAWLGMRVFGEKMVLSALNLQDKDFHLLDVLRSNYGQQFDVGTLQSKMREQGWNITNSDVRSALKNMKTKGYVRPDKTVTPHEWSASEFAKQVSREVNLDWPTIIEDTRELVYEHYPKPVAMDYENQFLEGEGLLVTHPFEGHTVNLTEQEANELEEKVEQQEEKEEEAFAGGMYDNDDNDDDNTKQGSLS